MRHAKGSPTRGAGAERLRGCTKTKPFPNEPPSVHTIPEGVLVILIFIVAIVAIVAENAILSTIATISTIIMS